jgi:hypothetical protein
MIMSTKVVVTNVAALRAKYGSGLSTVLEAVGKLAAADKLRGVETRLVALDEAKQMGDLGGTAVTKAADPKQNKGAIDGVYAALKPDYLVLLGATDVIPHQDVRNPAFSSEDPDRYAYGDLPYACDTPYSQKVGDFTGPTRVVGRIPDVTGASDVGYLRNVLAIASA